MHTFKRGFCALLALCLMFLSTLALAAETPKARTSEHYDTYTSDTLTIDITREEWTFKSHKLKFLVARVHVEDPAQLRTAFAGDVYDKKMVEDTESIAERNGAVLAFNGDYYNHKDNVGIIIRNGELYREKKSTRDLMTIDRNGLMETYLKSEREETPIPAEDLMLEGVVQAFEFGPALVRDGEALEMPSKYIITTNDRIREPRTAIGQTADGDYVVVVADGRRDGWSDKGMTLQELAQVFVEQGCVTAYNLDGGGSATLYYNGEIINKPAGGGQRRVSDIVYFVP